MKKDTTFRLWSGFEHGAGEDLSKDKWAQQIVIATIKRYIGIDLSKAVIEGVTDIPKVETLQVSINLKGEVLRTYYIESILRGSVVVKIKDKSALGKDSVGLIAQAWLEQLGFPADYPHTQEVEIRQGGLEVQVIPAF
jgi:hypothetical protein